MTAEGAEKILNQDEVDALINGIDAGAVSTDSSLPPGEARAYDFINDLHVARGRLPALEMINERFARLFHQTLYHLMRRSPEISVSQVTMKKFNDYVNTLNMPTNLNIVRINPLRGLGLVVMDPKLVFTAVDNLFGGVGRHAKVEGRDFTATEQRIIKLLLRHAFNNLKEAWSKVLALDFEHVHSEINPHFAKIVNPTEIVVVSSFHVELHGGGGELHVTMPYSMLEPLRELLDAGGTGDATERDVRWTSALRDEVDDAEIELNAVLGESTVTLAELLNLKSGDVIPCDFNGSITLNAEAVPLFRGAFGISRGQQAVKINERLNRVKAAIAANPFLKKS
ncbi:MAG TPA: flagellar motor switch protein FliM [Steroidobacteraceae bacterium]|nr:flagellar motor switch protein FliM [Steroidobacteraceae bacterium]